MSVAEQAKAVYQEEFQKRLVVDNFGDFVAIEPESREAFVRTSFIDAALAAKKAHPTKTSFVIRIGYEAAVHIGAATK